MKKKVVLGISDASHRYFKITLLRLENDSFKIDEIDQKNSGLDVIPERFQYKNVKVTMYWQDNALFTL